MHVYRFSYFLMSNTSCLRLYIIHLKCFWYHFLAYLFCKSTIEFLKFTSSPKDLMVLNLWNSHVFDRFNDGFTHLLYGDGQEMHKRMKPNNLLIILRAHHPVTDKIRWRKV